MTQYELVVDIGRPLLSNHRLGYHAKARETAKWREAAFVLARAAKIPRLGSVHVGAWGRYPTRKLPDVGGVAPTLKAVLDGIVDAGILEDDKAPFVVCESYYEPLCEPGCQAGLVVLLTTVGDEWVHPGRAA